MGWLLGSMMVLLFQACYSYDYDLPKTEPTLQIHVFTPERPVVTRASGDPVAAETLEKQVIDLHIWVFEHHGAGLDDDGKLVGYLHPTDFTNTGGTYLMSVSDEFATKRPHVDVYVLANVSAGNCGLALPLNAETTRDQLDGILIAHAGSNDFFGLTAPQSEVPTTDPDDPTKSLGLPMSGVLKDQELSYNAPVLSVGNVQVVRAVSKVRFIFSRSASAPDVVVRKITIDGGVIPTAEYLFLSGAYPDERCRIKAASGYEDNESHEFSMKECELTLPSSLDPAQFAHNGAISGQEYESLINTELTKTETETVKREIVEGGRFYLRESDKQVTGKIWYTVGEDTTPRSENFSLSAAGDFTRNHTWIVYGYFAGSNNLRILTVSFTDWDPLQENAHSVYNW